MSIQTKKIKLIAKALLKTKIKTAKELNTFKKQMAKKYQEQFPKNIALLKACREFTKDVPFQLAALLRTRPMRSLSGIVNVSVLTKPWPCPGKCIFCPTEKGVPKSYLKTEPAVQRALLNKFSPYKQVRTRLRALRMTGHPTDKIELRILGGTWSYYPKTYQRWFVKECFRAANNFSINPKSKITNPKQIQNSKSKILNYLQKRNEKSKHRIIGVTIETRPDYIDTQEIKRLRQLGVTRVELGVQSIYDEVLKLNKRGHNVACTMKATKLLKNAGFKVSYQVMPNLAGSSFKKDVDMFKELFSNPNFKPDLLKIYPLALLKQTPLYKLYQQKRYKPYSEKRLAQLLIEIKQHIPAWCRIERIIRDISTYHIIEGGTKTSNLREIVQKQMAEKGLKCKCIRCREVGASYDPKEKLYLFRENYMASGGKEVFLSFENKNRSKLYALLRLRLAEAPAGAKAGFAVLKNAAIIREVHTYGQLMPLNSAHPVRSKASNGAQHKGLGRKLIKKAEKIAKTEFSAKKIAIISGIGARGYYRAKLGYRLQNTYMVKNL